MGFSRQECWSGLPCPPSSDLPNPGIEPVSLMFPALAGKFLTTSATWEALVAQMVKNLPAMRKTQVRSLGWEDSPEKGMATSIWGCIIVLCTIGCLTTSLMLWNVCIPPPKYTWWNQAPNVIVSGSRAERTGLSHKGGAPMSEMSVFIKETPESSLSPSTMWAHS